MLQTPKPIMQVAKKPEDIPDGPHYAIIVFDKINHDDGYGGNTTTDTLEYSFTKKKDVWVEHIKFLEERFQTFYGNFKPYVALQIEAKAKIKTEVIVSVETQT